MCCNAWLLSWPESLIKSAQFSETKLPLSILSFILRFLARLCLSYWREGANSDVKNSWAPVDLSKWNFSHAWNYASALCFAISGSNPEWCSCILQGTYCRYCLQWLIVFQDVVMHYHQIAVRREEYVYLQGNKGLCRDNLQFHVYFWKYFANSCFLVINATEKLVECYSGKTVLFLVLKKCYSELR